MRSSISIHSRCIDRLASVGASMRISSGVAQLVDLVVPPSTYARVREAAKLAGMVLFTRDEE